MITVTLQYTEILIILHINLLMELHMQPLIMELHMQPLLITTIVESLLHIMEDIINQVFPTVATMVV